MDKQEVLKYQEIHRNSSAEQVLQWAVDYFGQNKLALASSLGVEDQVLTHMLVNINPKVSIFTLDTGRLPQETYDIIEQTMEKYNFRYEFLFPETSAVEEMQRQYGPNLFYRSVDNRKKCCYVRKVEPLKRKLAHLDAWICGLRRAQSLTRADIEKIEWDSANKIVKINPLAYWSEEQTWEYIRKHNIPYNQLHDKGYPSIGCAPCTRAVKPGEGIRAGRWWWESPREKECGLHKREES
jgi:phosphoadenosine phosphosulfate reductase